MPCSVLGHTALGACLPLPANPPTLLTFRRRGRPDGACRHLVLGVQLDLAGVAGAHRLWGISGRLQPDRPRRAGLAVDEAAVAAVVPPEDRAEAEVAQVAHDGVAIGLPFLPHGRGKGAQAVAQPEIMTLHDRRRDCAPAGHTRDTRTRRRAPSHGRATGGHVLPLWGNVCPARYLCIKYPGSKPQVYPHLGKSPK